MTWLSFDDGFTRERVWEGVPYDARWHYHALAEYCCATRRYEGVIRWADALRCSDVPDADRCTKDLIAVGLVVDLGASVRIVHIDDFLPPPSERPERLLPRKRKNQQEYRRRKCEAGEHDSHCPASCPERGGELR